MDYSLGFDKPMTQQLDIHTVAQFLRNCEGMTIAVIGDVMLDRYFWGSVSRISPEAPVPVIDVEKESFHLGGAANVALNLRSLGCNALLCGVVGADNSGGIIQSVAAQSGLAGGGILALDSRPTTVKTRIIGNNQQIARLDREVRDDIAPDEAAALIRLLEARDDIAGIIIEDYNKGVVSAEVIAGVRALSHDRNIPVFVDPKHRHFFEFTGVACFKPNRKEAQEALGFSLKSDADVYRAGRELLARLRCENVLLTLGERGMMLFESNGAIDSVPTRARHVADVSGAGDTAIATLAAMTAGGATMKQAAALANIAAGLVCEEPGIVTIQAERLLDAFALYASEEQ